MGLDALVREFANVGGTILIVIIAILIVRWLDRNVFNKRR